MSSSMKPRAGEASASRLVFALLALGSCAACGAAALRALPWIRVWFTAQPASAALLAGALLASAGILLSGFLRSGARAPWPAGRSFRWGLILAGALPATIALASPHADARLTDLTLAVAGLLLASLARFGGRIEGAQAAWLWRWPQGLLLPLLLTLFLLEGGLRLAAALVPHPIFSRSGGEAPALVRDLALRPGSSLYGYRVSSAGHPDEELGEPGGDDARARIALIGDSFGVSMVPWPLHHATVAERSLARHGRPTAIQNIAVPGVGMAEYAHLIATQVPALGAERVVVSVFVGNDLHGAGLASLGVSEDERLFLRERWLLYRVASRLALLARDASEGGAQVRAGGEGAGVLFDYPDLSERPWSEERVRRFCREHFPAALDPTQEIATATPERLFQIERERARATTLPGQLDRARLRDALRQLREAAAPLPLGIAIIPDLYQIDDALWRELQAELAAGGARAERDQGSKLVRQLCEELELPVLDLTPPLRAAAEHRPERRLYHLGDTHLNAAGSRIFGAALAEWLLEWP